MLLKIIKKDFLKHKSITLTLFAFVMLAAFLVSSGTKVVMELSSSIDNLLEVSNTPHFVQMHTGEVNQSDIDDFVKSSTLVKEQQTTKMINIDGSHLFLGSSQVSLVDSVMDNYFVTQSETIDILLNLNNEQIQVSPGEIAVPIYYMQRNDLKIGDKVTIKQGDYSKELMITEYVRDAMMNPSLISSKRFVINETDFISITEHVGEIEYLIEFNLYDLSDIRTFTTAYQSSNLPKNGPFIDYSLFKMINMVTDGILAVIIILVSFLLMFIAFLSLRFTILATMEEDQREIGVMKAMGIDLKDIKKLYLMKYIFLVVLASMIGYILSLLMGHLFTSNMILYMGSVPKTFIQYFASFLAVFFVAVTCILFCMYVLRRFKKLSAVEALRSGSIGDGKISKRFFSLHKSKRVNVNIYLGLKNVLGRLKMFILLLFVFIICSFIIIVPINFHNTMQSSSFIRYMGIAQTDIRIDLQHSEDVNERFTDMIDYLEADDDVMTFSPLITSRFKMINNEGTLENINIETGDFSIFPLEYVAGTEPKHENEIALSYLNANEMNKKIGDELVILVEDQERTMTVIGIYQDITNGGKTAKAMLSTHSNTVLWYVISIDLKDDVSKSEKISEFALNFESTKITDMDYYISQTMGNTINQIRLITIIVIIISIVVAALITSFFLKMLLAKDASQIAIMKSIGFSTGDVRIQYIVSMILILGVGIITGTLLANTMGELLVSIFGSLFGASKIEFVINPLIAYVMCPIILLMVVTITTILGTLTLKESSITQMIKE